MNIENSGKLMFAKLIVHGPVRLQMDEIDEPIKFLLRTIKYFHARID